MMRPIWMPYVVVGVLFACGTKDNVNFSLAPDSKVEISIRDLSVDTLYLDSVPSSYMLFSGVHEDYLYVLDRRLCQLYRFETSGKLRDKKLGIGHAKNETDIIRPDLHAFLSDGSLFMNNANGDYYTYDADFIYKDRFRIHYNRRSDFTKSWEELYPSPYSYIDTDGQCCRAYGHRVFYSVCLSLRNGNDYFGQTENYLRQAANIVEVDLDKRGFGRLLAVGYPDSYRERPLSKALFNKVRFDVADNGDFFVTYQADSLIYCYDETYRPVACFGVEGTGMDKEYREFATEKETYENAREEISSKGFYNWLEWVDETGVLFRSYQKGDGADVDGLQIYRDGVLVGDVDVPKGLRVAGYVAPYYYSYVMPDEEREVLYVYRFKF